MSERTRTKKPAVREPASDATTSGNRTAAKRPKNLLLDADALANAESFSRRHGTTVSRLVSDYLRSLSDVGLDAELSPAVRRLYGIAAGSTADRETYREYLVAKYGGR